MMNSSISDIDDKDIKSAPLLGEDTEEILELAGFAGDEIEALEERKIVLCEGGAK